VASTCLIEYPFAKRVFAGALDTVRCYPADHYVVLDDKLRTLRRRRQLLPVVVPEIRVCGAAGDDQRVVTHRFCLARRQIGRETISAGEREPVAT
jgi:hypothetical protein